jgi:hypothetical protein
MSVPVWSYPLDDNNPEHRARIRHRKNAAEGVDKIQGAFAFLCREDIEAILRELQASLQSGFEPKSFKQAA